MDADAASPRARTDGEAAGVISREMVKLMRKTSGRGPTKARTTIGPGGTSKAAKARKAIARGETSKTTKAGKTIARGGTPKAAKAEALRARGHHLALEGAELAADAGVDQAVLHAQD